MVPSTTTIRLKGTNHKEKIAPATIKNKNKGENNLNKQAITIKRAKKAETLLTMLRDRLHKLRNVYNSMTRDEKNEFHKAQETGIQMSKYLDERSINNQASNGIGFDSEMEFFKTLEMGSRMPKKLKPVNILQKTAA